jgi:hypothetical protein
MLEIIGVDYPTLREQLFLAEGLSTEQLEVRILEGTESLEDWHQKNKLNGFASVKKKKKTQRENGDVLLDFNM